MHQSSLMSVNESVSFSSLETEVSVAVSMSFQPSKLSTALKPAEICGGVSGSGIGLMAVSAHFQEVHFQEVHFTQLIVTSVSSNRISGRGHMSIKLIRDNHKIGQMHSTYGDEIIIEE